MRILVTGGAGFKGCVLSELLLARGHEVSVFDRMSYGEAPAMGLLRRGVRVVRGDVTRFDQIAPEVATHDAIVHLAALVGFPLCESEPILAEAVNVQGTLNVIKAMSPGQRLVYASTGSVYGRVDQLCHEDQTPAPLTRYGRTKLLGERAALDSGAVSLRFATVMGVSPCMRFDLLVNAFVYRAIHMGWMVCYQADDRRSFLDVEDAARAYCLALDNYDAMSGEVFNVGAAHLNLSKRQIIEAVTQQFPMKVVYEDILSDPDQRNYEVDFSKVVTAGYRPEVSLKQSIEAVGSAAAFSDAQAPWRFRP